MGFTEPHLPSLTGYLERLLVDVRVIPHICPLCLAEEDEVLEEEDVAEALLLLEGHQEFILTNQLTLLFQVHLRRGKGWLVVVP